jgi:hypothetical protein
VLLPWATVLLAIAIPFAAATGGAALRDQRSYDPTSDPQSVSYVHSLIITRIPGGGLALHPRIERAGPPEPLQPSKGMVHVGQGAHVDVWADDVCKQNSKNGGQDDFPNPDNVSRIISAFDNKTYPGYDQVFNRQADMRVNIVSIDGPQNVGGNCCSGSSMNVDCADVYDRQYNYFGGPMIIAHEAYHFIHSGSAGQWVEEGQANMGGAMTTGPNDLSLLSGILGFFRQKHNEPIETCCSDAIQYGRAYSFWQYLVETYCGNATRKIVFDNPSSNGAAMAAQQCGNSGATFDTLLTDWEVANYVDDPRVPGGKYGYNETKFMEPMSESADAKVDTYPYSGSGSVQKHAAWYARFTLKPPAKGDLFLNFTVSSGTMRVFLAGTPTQASAVAEVKEITISGGKGSGSLAGLGLGFKDIGLVVSGIAQGSFTFEATTNTPTNGTISGRTIDQNFANVAGANVFAYQNGTSNLVAQTTSDASGNYAFPSIKAGRYDLVGNKTGYADGRTNNVDLVGGASASANIQMRKFGPQDQPGTVKGITKDTAAAPLGNVAVFAYKPGDRTNPVGQTTSSASGDYSLTLAGGPYDLVGRLAGYKDSEVLNVQVPAGSSIAQDIVMRPDVPDGTVSGTVKEKASGAGMQNVEVAGYVGATRVGFVLSDASGAYSLGLPPGTYEVKASKAGYVTVTVAGLKVESSKTLAQEFELEKSASQPGKGTLVVTVKDEAGAGIGGASLQVKGPSSRTGATAADGTATFTDLSPGNYEVSATAPGFKVASTTKVVQKDDVATATIVMKKEEGVGVPPGGSILDLQVGGVPLVGLLAAALVLVIVLGLLLPRLLRRGEKCHVCGFTNLRGAQICGSCAAPQARGAPQGPVPPTGKF